jgi:hypothetical protein
LQVKGWGFEIKVEEFRVSWGFLGLWVLGLRFRVKGVDLRVMGLKFRIQRLGLEN